MPLPFDRGFISSNFLVSTYYILHNRRQISLDDTLCKDPDNALQCSKATSVVIKKL